MNPTEKRLQQIYATLPTAERETLLTFAEFLLSRLPESVIIMEKQPIPRPAKESVIAAIKRLSATYPMLDKAPILNQTSALMSQHVMYGRTAEEVIDDLEVLFATQYQRLQQDVE